MFVRDQWTKAKSERKRLEEVLKRLKAEMQPLKDKHKEKEGQLNSSKQLQQVWVGKCMGSFSYITLGECNRRTLICVPYLYLILRLMSGVSNDRCFSLQYVQW